MPQNPNPLDIDLEDVAHAERVAQVAFHEEHRRQLLGKLRDFRRTALAVRDEPLPNALGPAIGFSALLPGSPLPPDRPPAAPTPTTGGDGTPDTLAFATVAEQAAALRSGATTSRALTDAYLARLERHDRDLACVATLLPELARAQAERADQELAQGIDRGPLHGIPFGAKDLLAHPSGPTAWGAAPFREQWIDARAIVLERLEDAGAVLLAKLSLGALAMGDVWYGGQTRNPWNLDEGASGSSAGSAAAVAAGLVGFGIGSETMGSILSPSERCGVFGLRPTFGRVPRSGAMALAWSFDKLGVLARSPEDAALVLAATAGADGVDPDARDAGFPWNPEASLSGLRVGVPEAHLRDPGPAMAVFLERLEVLELTAVPIALPELPGRPMMLLLMVEAAAAFDALVRNGGADRLTRQDDDAWPNLLRAARFVPAVDYLQAQRVRARAQRELATLYERVDVYACPTLDEASMQLGNGAGLPALSLPLGADARGRPLGSVSLVAKPFFEHEALRLGHALWRLEGPLRMPAGFEPG